MFKIEVNNKIVSNYFVILSQNFLKNYFAENQCNLKDISKLFAQNILILFWNVRYKLKFMLYKFSYFLNNLSETKISSIYKN